LPEVAGTAIRALHAIVALFGCAAFGKIYFPIAAARLILTGAIAGRSFISKAAKEPRTANIVRFQNAVLGDGAILVPVAFLPALVAGSFDLLVGAGVALRIARTLSIRMIRAKAFGCAGRNAAAISLIATGPAVENSIPDAADPTDTIGRISAGILLPILRQFRRNEERRRAGSIVCTIESCVTAGLLPDEPRTSLKLIIIERAWCVSAEGAIRVVAALRSIGAFALFGTFFPVLLLLIPAIVLLHLAERIAAVIREPVPVIALFGAALLYAVAAGRSLAIHAGTGRTTCLAGRQVAVWLYTQAQVGPSHCSP